MRKKGYQFTLIELLVTVAIIAILISIVIPALGRARTIAERTVCTNNLRQMCSATHSYAMDNKDYLPWKLKDEVVNSTWAPSPNFITMEYGDRDRYALHGQLYALRYLSSRKQMYCAPSAGDNAIHFAKQFLHGTWYSCSYNYLPAIGGRNGGTKGMVKKPEEMIYTRIHDRPKAGDYPGYNPTRFPLYMDIFGGRPKDAGNCELLRDYHAGAFNVSYLDGSVSGKSTGFLIAKISIWGWNNIHSRWPVLGN